MRNLRLFLMLLAYCCWAPIQSAIAYRWTVLNTEIEDICNNQKCGDRTHSICLAQSTAIPLANCTEHDFHWMPMGKEVRRFIVDGHNGIRNRVARSYFDPISNMNLLYWDEDLALMAKGWIGQCVINVTDSCTFIYNDSYTVGQNVAFFPKMTTDDWEIKALRSWYLEGNSVEISDLKIYRDLKQSSYTQLIWSDAQFVGCAAARFDDGFLMACNYFPKGNIVGKPVVKYGKPCTECSDDRPSCSRVFRGLCGLDLHASSSRRMGRRFVIFFAILLFL